MSPYLLPRPLSFSLPPQARVDRGLTFLGSLFSHDFQITANNTALMTGYQSKSWDLSTYSISEGYIWDGLVQEVDIATSGCCSFSHLSLPSPSDHGFTLLRF